MSIITGSIDCYCGRRIVLRTSWTEVNPGRRFHSCREYKRGGCNFFDWEDPPMCRRAQAIIPGLLRKKNDMEAEIFRLRRFQKSLWTCIVVQCLLWLLCKWVGYQLLFEELAKLQRIKDEDGCERLNYDV
ncbi:hypothetical protein Salat_1528900 [Sesamum alatum]|uniref:GRF-type domain-containing protein n=1 Tax=Sesamum alatum TaxID=300844 RepID=A0AAE1YC96_9LAMI|nr:hypothetical protein Salat_1528900 [Sesamum alatum]